MGGKRLAVLIGNGSFPRNDVDAAPHLPPLRCPPNDAAALAELLAADGRGGYAVTTLLDRPHGECRRAIYDCLKTAGPDDQVLIYYSGHGKVDEGGNLYLVGSDTDPESLHPTSFAAADLQKYVSESRAAVRIVILDCCYSGAVERALRGTVKGETADQARQVVRRLEGKGVFYLTASTDTQLAEEKEQDRFSLLTKHIIEGVRDGRADADQDGEVRFSELCGYVQDRIRQEGHQRPLAFTLKAYGDPVIALTGKKPLAERREAVEHAIYDLRQRRLLDGADAARILDWIQRPVEESVNGVFAVLALIDTLDRARSDSALLLKTALAFLSRSQVQKPQLPDPLPSFRTYLLRMSGKSAARLATTLAIVAIGLAGVVWTIWPNRESQKASVERTIPTVPSPPNTMQSAPSTGTTLTTPGPSTPLLQPVPPSLVAPDAHSLLAPSAGARSLVTAPSVNQP